MAVLMAGIGKHNSGWYGRWLVLAVLVLCAAGLVGLGGCDRQAAPPAAPLRPATPALDEHQVARIQRFCSDCHGMPDPGTFPKSRWEEEVNQGFQFYIDSGRTDLDEPTRAETVRYFRQAAPESIAIPEVPSHPASHRFKRTEPVTQLGKQTACVSHLIWNGQSRSLLLSDMRTGQVSLLQPDRQWHSHSLGQVTNSCRVTVCDWNADGRDDFVVCDLGSFPVGDHQRGSVQLWLANSDGTYQTHTLASQLGRVVEAQLIDYDEDGDQDLLIAEFGWRKTGALKLLRNPGGAWNPEVGWPIEVLDPRHGALGVQVADFDQDGRLDYLVSFGQEYETIELFHNLGHGEYQRQVIFQLADPSYNSSSTTLADIDGDGRIDIVHTNGDTMDAFLPKPYHGVRWLQNRDDGTWRVHELGLLVGALASCAADFDGDGDLDIAAVGMLPLSDQTTGLSIDSVVWWEQGDNLTFVRHALAQYGPSHAACTAGDVNQDGLPDLIVGNWDITVGPPLTVYVSQSDSHR